MMGRLNIRVIRVVVVVLMKMEVGFRLVMVSSLILIMKFSMR